jgi:MurNAc alpha-1-phosphate uridylyltransferase
MLPVAILMGGMAKRLGPLTQETPKALVEINGQPFVAHQLRLLQASGIRRAVLCVGHLGERIRQFVGTGERFGIAVQYSFDGPALCGTGGAIRQALPLLADPFFVLYGDSYLPCDYARVQRAFEESGREGLMTVYHNRGQWDASNVEFSGGRILSYGKQPDPRRHHIDYGLGVFRHTAFATLAPGQCCDLAEIYQALLTRGELVACEMQERFYEIGSVAGIQDLSRALSDGPTNS